jgi:hypothetical protein
VSTVYIRFPAPRLDGQAAATLNRAERLERLLARADASAESADWRAAAFRVLSPEEPPAVGPAGLCATATCCASVYVATPVHYQAAMTHVRMPPGGVLALTPAVAAELAVDFNRVFAAGGQRLYATHDGALYCTFAEPVATPTVDPALVEGQDIGAWLPPGDAGRQLRSLMSEIEMWLFDHRLNQRRVAEGGLPISGLWLWGGGPPLTRLPRLGGCVAGRDALFSAWGAEPTARRAGAGVVVLDAVPGTAAWDDAEAQWIVPALRALRARALAEIVLSAGLRRYSLRAHARWRWWRRPRPWWEYFA